MEAYTSFVTVNDLACNDDCPNLCVSKNWIKFLNDFSVQLAQGRIIKWLTLLTIFIKNKVVYEDRVGRWDYFGERCTCSKVTLNGFYPVDVNPTSKGAGTNLLCELLSVFWCQRRQFNAKCLTAIFKGSLADDICNTTADVDQHRGCVDLEFFQEAANELGHQLSIRWWSPWSVELCSSWWYVISIGGIDDGVKERNRDGIGWQEVLEVSRCTEEWRVGIDLTKDGEEWFLITIFQSYTELFEQSVCIPSR